MRSWLGRGPDYLPQPGGNLGERMGTLIEREFRRGAERVIVVGADCPRLSSDHYDAAAAALDHADIVFGPSRDGGYYLVGLRRPCPALFENIPWGESGVLAESIARARETGIEPMWLEKLSDVDLPPDLPDAEIALREGGSVSVIVPTLNEASSLRRLLPRLLDRPGAEVIVSDGGSDDDTVQIARDAGAIVVQGERGRGAQMNRGAAVAGGEFLLFLHADTDPPTDWNEIIPGVLSRPGVAAGAFRFALREPVAGRALIEWLVDLRCRVFRMPYGDQGFFLRKTLFTALGGFPNQPILEDLEMVSQARRWGSVEVVDAVARTSSRRWRERGVMRTFLDHQRILAGRWLGMAPEKLAHFSPRQYRCRRPRR